MSRSGIGANPAPRWIRCSNTKESPPASCSHVWLYCPGYTFMPVRKISAAMLEHCKDATYWRVALDKESTPSAPRKKG